MFRKQVLKILYSNEKWQSILQLKSPFNPFYYLLLFIVSVTFIVFLFFGTVSTRLSAQGIIIGKNSTIYSAVAQDNGQVETILVKIGDIVKKGQIVAHLSRHDLSNKIALQKKQLNLLSIEKQKLKIQKKQEMTIQSNHAKQQLDTLNTIINFQKSHIAKLQVAMLAREKMAEKGVISKIMIEEQERLFNDLIKSMNENNARILEVEGELLTLTHQWNERILDINKKILDQQVSLKQTEYNLYLAANVKSPVDGVVTGMSSTVGLYVKQGDELITISPDESDFDALLFLPANEGILVKKNTQVLVNPAGYPSEETGSILGYVVNVQSFPASKKELDMLLQNDTLAERLMGNQNSVIIVRARLIKDNHAPNHLLWTSSAGSSIVIQKGSLCSGQFVVKKNTPFQLILPTIKKTLGII